MVIRALMLAGLILVLAACGGGDNSMSQESPQGDAALVQWIHDPYHVVFRVETVGGDNAQAFFRLNEVPLCTIYGDGRVVWTEESSGRSTPRVLFDYLTDDKIIEFALFLTVEGRFLTYTEEYPHQIPSSSVPVYEKMTLAINDFTHITDAFSNWPTGYFDSIITYCRTIGVTPRRFEPEGAWLSAQPVTYNPNLPSIIWDAAAAGFSFREVASTQEKRWIEGNLVTILWRALYDNSYDVQFDESGTVFQIALQVPGVTKDAPPAPAEEPQS